MKSREDMSEGNGDRSQRGTASTGSHDKSNLQRRSTSERLFHQLARVFNGLHWAIGITTLPENATAREERSFVLMWLGIIAFMVVFFAIMLYLL
jgi:hypothetical protein